MHSSTEVLHPTPASHNTRGGTPVTLTLQKDRQQGQEVKGIFGYVAVCCCFLDSISLCNPGCPGIYYVGQAGFELSDPPDKSFLRHMRIPQGIPALYVYIWGAAPYVYTGSVSPEPPHTFSLTGQPTIFHSCARHSSAVFHNPSFIAKETESWRVVSS